MPNWQNLNPNDGPENCKKAMEVAEKNFRIPMVLEPEWLASPHLDELSGMLNYYGPVKVNQKMKFSGLKLWV